MRRNNNPPNDDVIDRFLDYLHFREMSSKKDAASLRHFNKSGYVGAFQMGNMALQDAGLMNIGELVGETRQERTMNGSNWVGGEAARDAFLGNYDQQRLAARKLAERNHRSLKSTFKKQGITGEHDVAAYLAGAHLLGARSVREQLTGKNTGRKDANGTSIQNYVDGYYKWSEQPAWKAPAPAGPKAEPWQEVGAPPEGHVTNPEPEFVQPTMEQPVQQTQFAAGGSMGFSTYGNDINMFNEGGSHAANPAGGVTIGMGANGQPNTVQEREAMYKLDLGNGEKEKVIYANDDNISYEN